MPSQVQNGSVSADDVRHQVERILQSSEFGGSEVLRNLLAFLTRHSLANPGEVVKEYELAVAVLGRREDFDPRLDSAVRVHTARLRAKLAEYYMAAGTADSILIEVPKGSYQIHWRHRALEAAPHVEPAEPVILPAPPRVPRRQFAIGFASALALAASAAGLWWLARPTPAPKAVDAFWRPFLRPANPPIIVFSNHRFIGSSVTGLHAYREGVDSPADVNDTYSGTGTVMAVGELGGLFSLYGRSARLKRAELLTWDEARDANVVFVGAPIANSRLKEMAPLQHFAFKSGFEEPDLGKGAIVNLHPAPGEQPIYLGTSRPFLYDYFVIALLPNLRPDRSVLILAGTNTYGCQAAAEFTLRSDLLRDLSSRLGVPANGAYPNFEALFRVEISGGVPVHPEIVAVRLRQSASKRP